MTFEEILALVGDSSKTRYQLAADIHAMLQAQERPSALNIQPVKERKKRAPNKPKPELISSISEPYMNGADHGGHQ